MRTTGLRQRLAAGLTMALLLVSLGVGGCALPTPGASSAPTTPPLAAGQWGLPFRAGTQVMLGDFGLHDDNYHGLSNFTLDNATLATSALDIVPVDQSAPTAVIPLAPGQILAWQPACHFLLVNHYHGVWVGYQHLDLNPRFQVGSLVDRTMTLGYTAAAPINTPNCEIAPVRHIHFAFLSGSGNVGAYVSMVGQTLCGHVVATSAPTASAPHGGAITGLASAPGQPFTVPDCDAGQGRTTGNTTTPTVAPAPSPTARAQSACTALTEFATDGSAAVLATQFMGGDPRIPAPSQSIGHVQKVFDDPAVGEPGMVYHFELVSVCAPATTPNGVKAFYARQMPQTDGWAQSDTFPYAGDFSRACGDPYCWVWGPPGGDISRFASLESVTQAGDVTTYQLRIGYERPQ